MPSTGKIKSSQPLGVRKNKDGKTKNVVGKEEKKRETMEKKKRKQLLSGRILKNNEI